jgi:hypothetical protein
VPLLVRVVRSLVPLLVRVVRSLLPWLVVEGVAAEVGDNTLLAGDGQYCRPDPWWVDVE